MQHVKTNNDILSRQLFEHGGKGRLLNPLPHYYNKIEYKLSNHYSPKRKPFLLALFDENGCPSCLDYNIKILNQFKLKYDSNLLVFYQGTEGKYLKKYKPNFEYYVIDSNYELFTKKMDYAKPLLFFIGRDNVVYDIHRSEVTSLNKTKIFFDKTEKILDAIYAKPDI